ncbi:MAG: RNA polymerase sigma factor [Bacteroidia bacterium]|nr:RNA polymerase sigma factor [Bacteroidia bacterium]
MTPSPEIAISLVLADEKDPGLVQLIELCMANDRQAQELLYRQYYGKAMGMCMRYFANRDDALEALNAGFLKVYNNLGSYRFDGAFEGWLFRIIYNSIIDHCRARMRQVKTVDLEEVNDSQTGMEALQQLYAVDLLKMLDHLPDASRTVFNMFAVEGYKHEEIAKTLNISEGTSKWHVNNARTILKTLIEKSNLRS